MISVAAYCRVSTDKEDQSNSFAAQQRYFREYIQTQETWSLWDIYADEGITGTSTKKRSQFIRMMEDARSGKFSLILTKEVSRFARNILDAVSFTRELRSLGIGVIFLTDGINTLDSDAELRLSILGSIAQEDSRRTSQRVKWGQTRQMERGVVFGHSLIGYDLRNGRLCVEPEGAKIVRTIFQKYALEKKSSSAIAEELSALCGGNWTSGKVIRILKNEKYVGDLVQKKTYTPDYLSHEKKKNQGQEPMIILRDHHSPIISRTLWNETQRELQRRSRQPKAGENCSNRYDLSGKIRCGQCGHIFVLRSKKRKDGSMCRRWICGQSGTCQVGKTLRDTLAKEAIHAAVLSLIRNDPSFICEVVQLIMQASAKAKEKRLKFNEEQKVRIYRKIDGILDLYHLGNISSDEMRRNYNRYKMQLESMHRNVPLKGISETELEETVNRILEGRCESSIFIKTILSEIIVFRDRHLELYLSDIDVPWVFQFI